MITTTEYTALDEAYDYFNAELFDGALPLILFTFQRKHGAAGYFSPNRFMHRFDEQERTHEIAMNPNTFRPGQDMEIIQTLVHEMVHVWQHHFGRPSRRGYHNKEFAKKMEEIGLMPSSTGRPGGKKTGQRMADYPIEGGLFEQKAKALLARGWRINWVSVDFMPLPDPTGEGTEGTEGQPPKPKPKSKVKFTCPLCGNNAWGKPSLALLCNNTEKHPDPHPMESEE